MTAALAACATARSHAQTSKPLAFFPTRAIWTLALNNALTQTPAYDETRGYFSIAGDRLVAYDIKTGTQRWIAAVAPTLTPACGDDLVFVPEKDAIVALRAQDGSTAWRLPFEETLGVAPVWDNGWLVLATANGTIVAVSAKDGRPIWRRALGVALHARPALAADRVYVPLANAHVVALRVATGEDVWSRLLGGDPNDILALDERIYLGSTDNYAYCINAESGVVEWRHVTGADVIGVPAHDVDRVYFVSFDNTLRAFSLRTGVQQWLKQLPLRPTAGPVLAGATIIAAGPATALSTYNARDGAAVGSLTTAPELAAPPQVVVDPANGQPMVVLVAADLAKGAAVSLVGRGIDPTPSPLGLLPGALTVLPAASTQAAPRQSRQPRQPRQQ
ncbi:MAG TPA: PQQ-binding-like beta-propeller repeat protein [Vicinamibacterales bacterium]|nr:PQQ-binding-like beta-propeller repeat protein [Vicinamibacterales bacterium]